MIKLSILDSVLTDCVKLGSVQTISPANVHAASHFAPVDRAHDSCLPGDRPMEWIGVYVPAVSSKTNCSSDLQNFMSH